jgi:hypothetical protein
MAYLAEIGVADRLESWRATASELGMESSAA